jgi:ankyrin repeat protein
LPISYRAAQTLIKRNDEATLRSALEAGLDPNAANQNGWTLLMLAAVEGHLALAEALLNKGAALDRTNSKGETALTIAHAKGHTAFAEFLQSR